MCLGFRVSGVKYRGVAETAGTGNRSVPSVAEAAEVWIDQDRTRSCKRLHRCPGASFAGAQLKVTTLEEVAQRAGVSTATVSRVLNSAGPVRESTRRRVLDVAESLRYQPNPAARTLAGGRSRILGMVASNLENPFFLDIFRGLEESASQAGYEVVVENTRYEPARLRASVLSMLGRQVAGLALMVSEREPTLTDLLGNSKVPVVLYDSDKLVERAASISVHYNTGMKRMAEYLYCLGHRTMAFVGHHCSLGPLRERERTFLALMRKHGHEVECSTVLNNDSPEGGALAARQLLNSGFAPTAIICVNDYMAIGVLRELHNRGLRVPQDISVTGFDNIRLSEFVVPALTTVDIPRSRIGQMTCEALLGSSPPAEAGSRDFVIQPELLVRESTGPARSRQ